MKQEHRMKSIVRSLVGRPKTIKEVARGQRVSYATAQRYLSDLLEGDQIYIYNKGHHPITYYIPLEKLK
jgi:translation initiation factor IF-2